MSRIYFTKIKKNIINALFASFLILFFFNSYTGHLSTTNPNLSNNIAYSAPITNPILWNVSISQNDIANTSNIHEFYQYDALLLNYDVANCKNLKYYFLFDGFLSDFGIITSDRELIIQKINSDDIGDHILSLIIRSDNLGYNMSGFILKNEISIHITENNLISISKYLPIGLGIIGGVILIPILTHFFSNQIMSSKLKKILKKSKFGPSVKMMINNDIFTSNKEIIKILKNFNEFNSFECNIDEIDEIDFIRCLEK